MSMFGLCFFLSYIIVTAIELAKRRNNKLQTFIEPYVVLQAKMLSKSKISKYCVVFWAFNVTFNPKFRYTYYVLSINNDQFHSYVDFVYPIKLETKNTT
jgi:hypothetical protein